MNPDRSARLLLRSVLLLAGLALAGCQTVADRRLHDEARCGSYGFRPGSDAYAKCLLDLDLNRDANRRALVNGPYGGFGGYGFGYGFGPRRGWW